MLPLALGCTGMQTVQRRNKGQAMEFSVFDQVISVLGIGLSKETEIFSVETGAMNHCVRELLRLGTGHKPIDLFADNQAVIKALPGLHHG